MSFSEAGVVIAGGGQAGFQLAMSLRERGYAGSIDLFDAEAGLPYQRPPLSKSYLKSDSAVLEFRPVAFFDHHGISLHPGCRVEAIDRVRRMVKLQDGSEQAYAHLVLANGTTPRRLSVPGADSSGVHEIRTRQDAGAIRAALGEVRRVVVIGAGFLGLEAAAVARGLGLDVHVVELGNRPMGRAVSGAVSSFFAAHHASAGIGFSFTTAVSAIATQDGKAVGVHAGADVLPADLVLVSIGVVPNTSLAAQAGLDIANGVAVDEYLLSSDPDISAIGDCASYPSPWLGARTRLESVQNAVDHARCLAARLTGMPAPFKAVPWFWSDQGDLRLQIAGLTSEADTTVRLGVADSNAFSVVCFRDGRFIGVESVNRPADHIAARKLLAAGTMLSPEAVAQLGFELRRT